MAVTPYMNLALPVVSTTLGPDWATALNTALETIDIHDHSSSKGVKITPSGMNISSDLTFNTSWSATDLKKTNYSSQSSSLTGASHSNSLYSVLGDLYYTNGAGVAVQVTSGGALVSTPGAANSFQFNDVSTNLTIGPADTYVYIAVDTNASRTITLPSAAAVTTGRIYAIKDATGLSETNPITLAADGSETIDGEATYSVESNYAVIFVIGNGIDGWYIV